MLRMCIVPKLICYNVGQYSENCVHGFNPRDPNDGVVPHTQLLHCDLCYYKLV
jgi:hypothetical protein